MKKILIGTHNKGKFREISYLVSKKYKKISPSKLNIPSPKETGKSFKANSELKANFFSKFVNYEVISDDSGLCIKSLKNKPGIFSARLAKKKGSFLKAMKYILKKLEKKKDRSATFICSLSYKSPTKKNNLNLLLINKTSALIINNILMIIAMLTILLGTIYPIIIEVLTNTRISVGGPYFNSTVLPILLPGFLLMSIAPVLSWQSNKIRKFKVYVLFFLILSFFVIIYSYFTNFNIWGFLGLILGCWIILASIISIILRFKFLIAFSYLKSINSFIAHIGVGIMIIGITFSSVYQNEYNFNISLGDQINVNDNILKLENIKVVEEKNYQSLKADFSLIKKDKIIGYIFPAKNYYPVSKMITTEAGIYHDWLKDIYITLGNEEDGIWSIKVYLNPLVSFIWIGVFIMIFSSMIAVLKK